MKKEIILRHEVCKKCKNFFLPKNKKDKICEKCKYENPK